MIRLEQNQLAKFLVNKIFKAHSQNEYQMHYTNTEVLKSLPVHDPLLRTKCRLRPPSNKFKIFSASPWRFSPKFYE